MYRVTSYSVSIIAEVRLDGLSISPINRTRLLHTPCISRARGALFGGSIYVRLSGIIGAFCYATHRGSIVPKSDLPLETHLIRNIFTRNTLDVLFRTATPSNLSTV